MALRSALIWGAVQSALRLVLSFVSIKVTAIYLGAPGLALVGQLANFLGLVQGGIGNAIQTGVIKLTAESEGDRERQIGIWRSAVSFALILIVPVSIGIMLLAVPISTWLFDSGAYWPVFVLAGPCLVLGVLGLILSGLLNGLKRMRDVSLSQMFAIAVGSALFIPLAWAFGVYGGLIGTALSLVGVALASLAVLVRLKLVRIEDLWGRPNRDLVREISRFYPPLLANAAIAPFALILVRNVLTDGLGIHEAGYWQAAWRLSDMYTLVLSTALSLYLMPHLSSCRTDKEFARELFSVTISVVALTAVAALALYLLRSLVVAVVFTREFSPVQNLMGWQLAGDVLRMATWPLRMALIIRHRTGWYISAEIAAPLLHAGFTALLLDSFGTNAATIGYAISYAITIVLLLTALSDFLKLHVGPKGHGQESA